MLGLPTSPLGDTPHHPYKSADSSATPFPIPVPASNVVAGYGLNHSASASDHEIDVQLTPSPLLQRGRFSYEELQRDVSADPPQHGGFAVDQDWAQHGSGREGGAQRGDAEGEVDLTAEDDGDDGGSADYLPIPSLTMGASSAVAVGQVAFI